MAALTRRLAACTDSTAVATKLCDSLSDLAATPERPSALVDVVVFLTASEERWVVATQTLTSYLRQETLEQDVQLELSGALLEWATQDSAHLNPKILHALVQCFQLATTCLSATGNVSRWRKWGNQVLTLVHRNAALINEHESFETEKDGIEGDYQVCILRIAALLLQGRNHVEKDDDMTRDLKTVTFIWKNLAKLATAFGPILKRKNEETDKATMNFSIEALMAAIVDSVEWSVGRLLRLLDGKTIGVPDPDRIQFLKLYWRAFQRLIVAFATSLECEVENWVVAVVNVTATFIYGSRHRFIPETSKTGRELRFILDQTLDVMEKLVTTVDDANHCQTKTRICTLLWHPTADMVRAVRERQPSQMVQSTDMKSSIQWSHLLVLTAFMVLGKSCKMSSIPENDAMNDSDRAAAITRLFARYRECASADSVSRSVEVSKLFMDLMLEILVDIVSMIELHLTLLKHTLHPDWMQRTLCWEIWRELLCVCWNETMACETLHMLIDLAQRDSTDLNEAYVLAHGVDAEILELIAFVFPDLPEYVQKWCMDQVTLVIEFISTHGPGHKFDLRVASQLNLLEKLVGIHFLTSCSGSWKHEWVARYLPICFECCGTVLDLLASKGKASREKSDHVLGMIRVLDTCLLVLRGVFDDSNPEQDENAELSVILVRMATEALSVLARSKQMTSFQGVGRTSQSIKLEKAGTRSFERALDTALYLLSKLGPVLKENKKNQCVQVIQDLCAIVSKAHSLEEIDTESETVILAARFVEVTLFDMQVAENDVDLVWSMMLDLFQMLVQASRICSYRKIQASLLLSVSLDALYSVLAHSNIPPKFSARLGSVCEAEEMQTLKQRVFMRKWTLDEVAKAVETAQSRTLQALKRSEHGSDQIFRDRFPDETLAFEAHSDRRSPSGKRQTGDDCDCVSPKRPKLDHFIALCQEIESSLSSIDDKTVATILSGKEVEDATAILRNLLAKILAS